MAVDIKGAYAILLQKVDAAVAKVMDKKVSVERQNEMELRDAISDAQIYKAELLKKAQEQRIDQLQEQLDKETAEK